MFYLLQGMTENIISSFKIIEKLFLQRPVFWHVNYLDIIFFFAKNNNSALIEEIKSIIL